MDDRIWIMIAAVVAVAAFGGFVQRVSGFGFGIVTMIFLPHILAVYGEANMLCSLLSVTLNLTIISRVGKNTDWKAIILPSIAFAAVNVPAVMLLRSRPNEFLFIMLGAVLVIMSVWFVFLSKRIRIKDSPLSALACGGISGLLGGLFSMSGPPAVVYFLESSKGDNLRYLGTIQAFFLITNAFSCVVKASNGFLTKDVALLYAAGLCGVLAGAGVGSLVFNRLDGGKLRKVVYAFMACAGLLNVVTGIIRLSNQGG